MILTVVTCYFQQIIKEQAGPAMEKTFITITTFCYPEFEIISITYTRDIIDLSFLSLQIMCVYSLVVIITVKKLHMKMRIKYLLYFKEILTKSSVGP